MGSFSDEDDSEPQNDEKYAWSQVSQREHMISKSQEVRVSKEYEDDWDGSKSIKEK